MAKLLSFFSNEVKHSSSISTVHVPTLITKNLLGAKIGKSPSWQSRIHPLRIECARTLDILVSVEEVFKPFLLELQQVIFAGYRPSYLAVILPEAPARKKEIKLFHDYLRSQNAIPVNS